MKKLYELDIRNPILNLVSALPLVLFGAYFVSSGLSIAWLFFFLMLRFPHEYLHKFGGKIIGVNSTINFWRLNATCKPDRPITAKENIVFSMFPYVAFWIIAIGLFVFSIVFSNLIAHQIALLLILYQTYASMGDIFFFALSFFYPKAVFIDEGTKIVVYEA
jgi:hypothetical protein